MQLIPIPLTDGHLNGLFPYWSAFLPHIAKRSKETVAELLAQVARRDVQPFLIWDETQNKPVALLGTRYHKRGNELIAEIVWTTGTGMKRWTHLLADLERYLAEHVGCVEIRPVCRPGWSRLLKRHGYRITHYTMEKRLRHG